MSTAYRVWVADRDAPEELTLPAEVDALLDEVAADPNHLDWPVIVDLTADDRPTLQLIVGDPAWSYLLWADQEDVLVADGTVPVDAETTFNSGGEPAWLHDDHALPPELARQAVSEYVLTGLRPACVRWRSRA